MAKTKTSSNKIQVYRRLLKVAQSYWPVFICGIVGTIVVSFSDAGFAYLIKPIINRGFINREAIFITWLPLIILCLFILRGLSGFVSSYSINRVARNVVMDFRRKIFKYLLQLPAQFYNQHSSGNLLSTIIYNVEQVAQASSEALIMALQETTLAVGLIIVMFVVNWKLTVFFCIIVPLISWVMKISSHRIRKISGNIQESVGEVTHIASEVIEAFKVVRLFGGQKYETDKFFKATRINQQRELKVVVTNSIGSSLVQLLLGIPIAVTLFFATQPTINITAGSFASVVSSLIMLLRPVRRLTMINSYIQKGIAGAQSIFALLDKDIEKDFGEKVISRVAGNIRFENVGFSYNEDMVLKDINLEIKAGQTVAIVGRSGSGKSTLVNLLPRFYDAQIGNILIDGTDIKDFRLENLRNQFAMVSQHTSLFNDTIARNIAYGSAKLDENRLRDAAKAAHALEFIEALPKGFDTMIGENGVMLSGGQRQRIAIARALFKNAPILILDEATASLDTHAERHIQAALENLMSDCTTVVIAHRLSTIENADWIIAMEKGTIVEKGTHRELLQKNGVYAELHRLQFNDSVNKDKDQQ